MDAIRRPSRRSALRAGLAAVAAGGMLPAARSQQGSRPARVLFLVGDYYHNPAMQETAWRKVLGTTGWRLMFAQEPSFITPEVMASADLYVMGRYSTDTQPVNISLGWSPDKIVEKRPAPEDFMSPQHEELIAKNVRRGMGLIAMHCAIWNPKSRLYLDVLGVDKPIMHGPVVTANMHGLNQDHPITKGIPEFSIGIDEVFDAVMKPGQHVPLYRAKQDAPARDAIGAWCRQEGEGRVVALLAGHTTGPYGSRQFQEIMWRSAHWALKRDIPPAPQDLSPTGSGRR
ncbi:MAG TPA: ThuA domain-containing protein [Bryobacteraceae bacterium]|nr:ThuA domain-containing protein [Bryobacteraceae bacterium]